ncbi:pentatricopeptide repeat-containing protein At1g77170, mitochondrial-like [Zingiber officinale]|nr:pentatricopeptide repeat-containing protein At1g77170, mitochondrial-like [Zingiber officinale]
MRPLGPLFAAAATAAESNVAFSAPFIPSPPSSSSSSSEQCLGDPATMVATRLEACADHRDLARTHAHVLRFHLLRASFHWNALIRCYLRLGRPRASLSLYAQMCRSGATRDRYTLPLAVKAAALLFAFASGVQLHCTAFKLGLACHEFTESGLISLYAKAGLFGSAAKVFDQSAHRKLGSWNAIISGLTQGGRLREAMNAFVELRRSGLVPDDVTMVSLASACGGLGDIDLAEQVHKCLLQAGRSGRLEVTLSNSLIDMYAKCGRTDLARKVFVRMSRRDVSSWTSMIMSLAVQGEESTALDLFQEMQLDGVRPNKVTFVAVLSACAHGGLVDEGMNYLEAMTKEFNLVPTVAHYGCIVDMLGKLGQLEQARTVVETMPMEANSVVWGSLLGACEKHANVEVGEWAAKNLLDLEPWNDGVYVVLSNIYAEAKNWREVERIRKLMKDRRVAKAPGYSSSLT